MISIEYRIAISAVPALLLVLLCVSPARADLESEPLSQRRWEEIVVVAGRVPRPAREVGSTLTVLDADDIHARQIDLGSELLREVPGVAVNRSGQVGNVTQVRIRGAEGNHTLVLLDGIEANDPGFGSEFNFANLLTYGVSRIEVLRGPQSALYGSEAIGGVISITTTVPEAGFGASAEVEGGSYGTSRIGASVSGASDAVSALVSAVRYDTDGISASAIEPEKDGYRTVALHGKLDAHLGDHLSARLVLHRSDNRVQTDRQDFDFPPTATEGLIVDSNGHTESAQDYGLLALNAEQLDGHWLQRAAFGYTDTSTDNFADGLRNGGNRGRRKKFEYQSTLRMGKGRWHHDLTGGIQRERLDFTGLSATVAGANQSRSDAQTSLIAEYAVSHARDGSLSVSVRHDDNDRFEDATTVRATASWLARSSATRFHGSYGEGITDPSFVELFGFVPSSFVGNPDLRPEQSTGWDLGVAQALDGGRALLDVTYFHATLTGEITTVFDFDTFTSTAVNQQGDSNRRGVEIAFDAAVGTAWSVHGTYTWLDATEPDGRREVRRPQHSGSLDLDYTFLGGRGNLNLGALFNGSRQDAEFIPATPATRVTLDGYTVVNAAIGYQVTPRLELFARGENLLDEDYTEVFGYRSPGSAVYLGMRARL